MKSGLVRVLASFGALLFVASLLLLPYSDMERFSELYSAMGPGDSEEYWLMRDELLTPKYLLQDYGLTLLIVALGLHVVRASGTTGPRSPKGAVLLIALAIILPFASVAGYAFDLVQGLIRDEFPHWADSLGIPLSGVPRLLMYLLPWSLLHLLFLMGGYEAAPLRSALSMHANWWLLVLVGVTGLVMIIALAVGQYWYALPAALWLYFYLSLAAGRRAATIAHTS